METATYSSCCTAHEMDLSERKNLALSALSKEQIITHLSATYKVSRKFIYEQINMAMKAIDDVFSDTTEEEQVLYYLPVTKSWIQQFIISLILNCRSCFRGVIKTVDDVLDLNISIGTIFNTIKGATNKAKDINGQEDLQNIKMGVEDELFQHNKPVLVGVDVESLYCYLLSQEEQRDGETWGINLLDLVKKGFNPERIIADDGNGLRAGHEMVFPNVPCDGDNFHIMETLQESRRFFRNQLKSAITYLKKMEKKMHQAKEHKNTQKYSRRLGAARKKEKELRHISQSIDTLVNWLEYDVFNKAGPNPKIRRELYDFIVDEFMKLEKIHQHRIREVRIALQNQRELLLAFCDVLHTKFEKIAEQFSCSTEVIWKICELQKCKHGGDKYAIRHIPFLDFFDENFYAIEDAIIHAMNKTERTSSMVENLNSRLRPYFFLRKEIGCNYLELLRFYLNHTKFLRSSQPHRKGKTPAEILSGNEHKHWLEMLGFKKFKRNN